MSYELVYPHRAEKNIKKLDPFTKKIISKSLLKLKTNSIVYSEKLTDSKITELYGKIIKKYPESEYAKKASERLSALKQKK